MNHAFLTALAGVLLTTVCGLGFTTWDWNYDGILLPEAEWAQADQSTSLIPRIVNVRKNVIGDVEILVKGDVVTFVGLREKLRVFADRYREDDGWSWTAVLIRADRRIPWSIVRRILDVCEEPEVRIYKVQFGTLKPRSRR